MTDKRVTGEAALPQAAATSAAADKSALRLQLRRFIAALDPDYLRRSDDAITRRVLESERFCAAPIIFTYHSVGSEVSTAAIISAALGDGKVVALPVALPGGLMFFSASPPTDTYRGIPQPPADSLPLTATERDVILLPALCCDAAGRRLGYGGGYYDRYLAGCAAYKIALCRRMLLREALPAEAHDVTADEVITDWL